jgi:hypothetical protein
MDITALLSYLLAFAAIVTGALLMWGKNDLIIPASGTSLRLPCSFFLWVLAVVFWSMATSADDEDDNL